MLLKFAFFLTLFAAICNIPRVSSADESSPKKTGWLPGMLKAFGIIKRGDPKLEPRQMADKKSESEDNEKPPYTWTEFLTKFGYLGVLKDGVQHDSASIASATKKAQKKFNLPATGVPDKKTTKDLLKTRCGFPDFADPNSTSYAFLGGKWKEGEKVKWRLINYWRQKKIPEATQLTLVKKALSVWSNVANIDFEEIKTGKANISIKFGDRYHGDPFPFDGKGGVLAHAFQPPNGDVHFDNDEPFTDQPGPGIQFLVTAAHEIGHALGLAHSDVRSALMFPYSKPYDPNFALDKDDIAGIQDKYGKRKG